jgi:hypothetical protein
MENIETSEWFWAIVEKAALSREKLKEILISFSKEEIIRFQEEFVDASIELQCEPYTDYMEESEDGMGRIIISQKRILNAVHRI